MNELAHEITTAFVDKFPGMLKDVLMQAIIKSKHAAKKSSREYALLAAPMHKYTLKLGWLYKQGVQVVIYFSSPCWPLYYILFLSI